MILVVVSRCPWLLANRPWKSAGCKALPCWAFQAEIKTNELLATHELNVLALILLKLKIEKDLYPSLPDVRDL